MSQLQKSASKASHAFCSHSRKLLAASLSAVFALSLAPAAMAESYWWTGASDDDNNYSTSANWGSEKGTTYPGSGDGAMFLVDAKSKTVTFNSSYTPGWAWVNTGSLENPVIWDAPSSEFGMTTIWNIGLADNSDQTGALQIDSGLYTAGGAFRIGIEGKAAFTMTGGTLVSTGVSEWGTTNATISSTISGGTIKFNGNGGNEDSNPQAFAALDMMNGSNIVNTINIAGGTVAVNGGDLKIGRNDADGTSTTIINISDKGVLSCGTDTTERWLKLGVDGAGAETINVNDGGTLAFWFITHTSTGTAKLKVNGGTLKFLGTTTFNNGSIDPYYTGETDSFTVSIEENGGTFDADTNISINKVVTGTGSLTKKGTGRLTFNVMPVFKGKLTVAEGAGSVILPADATIEAGAGTDRRTLTDGTVEYFHGSVSSSSTLFTEGADATITLAGDTYLDIDKTVAIGKLTITGSGNLHLSGSAVVTATSLDIVSGATVQLASGTNLATGPLQTTSVTGAGTIVYDAVPDGTLSDLKPDEAGYTQDTWTGTVWIQNCIYRTATGTLFTDLSAYGNAGSRIKLTNAKMYFAQGMNCAVPVELANTDANGVARDFAIDLTNGYGNGASVQRLAKITGDGTFKTENAGGNEVVSIVDISDFSGKFDLATKIVVLGDTDGTVADEYKSRQAAGTTAPGAGTIVIPAGVTVSVPAAQTWSLAYGFVGAGTLKYTHPWQVGEKSLSTSEDWVGTTELAACENAGTSGVIVYPQRMGGVNSTVVFKGLGPKDGDTATYASYWIDTKTIDTTLRLDGDITLYGNGYSGATNPTTVKKLTGSGNFTLLTALSDVTYYDVTLDGYTGMLAAKPGQDCIRVAMIATDSPVGGEKLAAVDETLNNVTTLGYVIVNGESHPVTAALQSGADGYGLYVAAVQRNVYWIGGASGSWSEAGNWALADGTVLTASPGSAAADYMANAGDNVVFTNAATVVADSRPVITKMTLNADVVLSTTDAFKDNTYSGMKYLFVETVEGTGTLTMANAVIAAIGSGRPFKIYTPVCIAKETTNTFGCSTFVNYLYGDLSGSGLVTVGNGNWGGLSLQGDNSQFAGAFVSTQADTRNASNFSGADASSALASWTICAQSQNGINTSTYLTDNSTYYFGALNGYLQLGEKSSTPTLEIGARGEDSACQLVGRHDDAKLIYRRYNITKLGDGTFTLSSGSTRPGTINIKAGSVAFPDDLLFGTYSTIKFSGKDATLVYDGTEDISRYIADSSSAIVIDTDASPIWASALATSNVGGLTKKGAGTLTLTAVPLYKGPTVVTAGKLVVPFGTKFESLTLEGDAKVEVDMSTAVDNALAFSSGKFTGDAANVTLQDNAPEGYSGVQSLGSNETIIYGNGSRTFTWVGPTPSTDEGGTDDYLWTTPSNWSVSDESTTDYPTALDDVVFNTGKPGFNIVADMTVKSVTVNGSDSFTFEADHTLTVLGDFKLTNGGTLYVSGAGALEVNGSLSGVNMVEMSAQSATYEIISAHPYYTEKLSATEDLEVTWLAGAGTIASSADQTVTIADEDATSTFFGTLSGAMGLKKAGAGTLELQGPNTFTGDVAIDAGTLKLGSIFDSLKSSCRYQFAADDTRNFSFVNGSTTQIATLKGAFGEALNKDSGTYAEYVESDSDYFNGKPFIKFQSGQYSPTRKHYSSSSVFVYQKNTAASGDECLGYYKSDSNIDYFYINGASWYLNNNGTQNAWALFSDGAHSTAFTVGKKSVVAIDKWMVSSANREDHIGTSFNGAVAEAWGFTKTLSLEERAAAEAYLMQKWGCDDAEDHQILPKTANVTMKAGTTLDLGGMTQTVKSFAGAGTVRNGALKTATGVVTATGALTIPAVKGQTYELGAANLTLTAGEKGAIVKVPDDAKALGRLIVPHGWTVGADAACDVVVTDLPKNWNVRPQRKGDETDQWFIGPNAFVIHFR